MDNFVERSGGQVSEVIVTRTADCPDLRLSGTIEDEEDQIFEKVILRMVAPLSLVCLVLTGIVYLIFPSPQKQWAKDKIVLINVVFSGLFCALYFIFHLTNPSTFHLDCPNILCRFVKYTLLIRISNGCNSSSCLVSLRLTCLSLAG